MSVLRLPKPQQARHVKARNTDRKVQLADGLQLQWLGKSADGEREHHHVHIGTKQEAKIIKICRGWAWLSPTGEKHLEDNLKHFMQLKSWTPIGGRTKCLMMSMIIH